MGCACLAQWAPSSPCGQLVPTRVRAMHVVTEQNDQSRVRDLSSLTIRLCVRVQNMRHPSDTGISLAEA